MNFYVYRLLNSNNEVLYVGKTKNLNQRITCHKRGYSQVANLIPSGIANIEYIEMNSETDMSIKELYYISVLKPKLNVKLTVGVSLLNFTDDWVLFEPEIKTEKECSVWEEAKAILALELGLDRILLCRFEAGVSALLRMKYGVRTVADFNQNEREIILCDVRKFISIYKAQ